MAAARWARCPGFYAWARRVAVGASLGVAAAPAAASPEQPTPEEMNFLNAVRGNFPGDDRQLVMTGEQACTMLAYASAMRGASSGGWAG